MIIYTCDDLKQTALHFPLLEFCLHLGPAFPQVTMHFEVELMLIFKGQEARQVLP